MSIWSRIKKLFGINQPKRLQEAQIDNKFEDNSYKESIQVNPRELDEARARQQKEQQRDFQVMFAIKNLCGTGVNLFGLDFTNMLQSTLKRYGYPSEEIQLDQLDIEILSRANIGLNRRESKKLSEYINNSQNPTEAAKILMNQAREKAIITAREWQCNEKEAYRYVPTDIIFEFEQTIEEQKAKESEERNNL